VAILVGAALVGRRNRSSPIEHLVRQLLRRIGVGAKQSGFDPFAKRRTTVSANRATA